MIQLGTLITGIVLAGTTAAYTTIIFIQTRQSHKYLRIGILCSRMGVQVQKRSQFESQVTTIRLERIGLQTDGKLTNGAKKDLDYRECQCSKTITKVQNEITNLERKLKRLEKELDNCQAKSRKIIGFLLGRRK